VPFLTHQDTAASSDVNPESKASEAISTSKPMAATCETKRSFTLIVLLLLAMLESEVNNECECVREAGQR
jgi:hypothetical protein